VIGGSSGSSAPLKQILAALERDLPASVFVVQHRMAGAPAPVASLSTSSALSVRLAEDRKLIEKSSVYLAPAGRHLLLTSEGMRVVHGPRENLARPSIDVLFRSAAVAFGARVVGVILSGDLYDGAAGTAAIRRCGGYTIVQEPGDARNAALPRSALETSPSKTLPAELIGAHLNELVKQRVTAQAHVPRDLAFEAHAASLAMLDPNALSELGSPSHFTCPECQGPLWKMSGPPEEFRCDVGHAFSLQTLNRSQAHRLERALWVAHRVLAERARVLEHMANDSTQQGRTSIARDYTSRKQELVGHAQSILAVLASIEGPDSHHTELSVEDL